MKRIATPMIGGVITSAVFNLLIYPVIYVIWRKRSLPAVPPGGLPVSPGIPESRAIARSRRGVLAAAIAVSLAALIGGTYVFWSSGIGNSIMRSADPKAPVAKITQDGVIVSILSPDGQIHAKDNSLKIRFQDQNGHPVEAENVKLELNMNMPGMVMHSGAKISKERGSGNFQAHLTPDMAGDWSADLYYQGPQGPAKLTLPINVRQ
jgi:hypothetical protein